MNIGIDLRPLQHETRYRGIGRVLAEILQEIPNEQKNYLTFYIDRDLPRPKALSDFPNSAIRTAPSSRIARTRYIRSVAPTFPTIRSVEGLDVFLQVDINLGIPSGVPTVVFFHDLIPLLFRDQEKKPGGTGLRLFKNRLAGNMYWGKYLRSIKNYARASRVVCISDASRRDLLSYVPGVDPASATVLPLGVRIQKVTSSQAPSFPDKKQIQKYLLYVGGIDLRKNIVGLLNTLISLDRRGIHDLGLVVVGKEFSLDDQLEDTGWTKILETNPRIAERVITTGYVSDADLGRLYRDATAFVFPSRYEGFGLPVLEAMRYGCPVVAYSNSSIPEVAGNAALLVEDGAPLDDAILKLLKDPELAQKLKLAGLERVKEFSWTKTYLLLSRVLEDVAASKEPG